jgi:flagellum-specific ATP synthase
MSGSILLEQLRGADLVTRTGRVRRIFPTFIEADGPSVSLGAFCEIETQTSPDGAGPRMMLSQVASISRDSIVLTPLESGPQTFSGARVVACGKGGELGVGDAFLGRAIDALGRPIDGLGSIRPDSFSTPDGGIISPFDRTTSQVRVETGVRAIDGLLTLGRGQRIGVFAASGVGKTSLLLELAGSVAADRCVACFVGERGREVEAFWSTGLSSEGKARTTLVAATSDQPAATRVRAVSQALAIADHWRAEGYHVLLLLDSVTRLAMAIREIGLAAGEPPTVRAYTPAVFSALPKVVERCGALKSGGATTAVMTILSETDDVDDPISEVMRALLDGHIVLSRALAEQGHFPAIDVPRSLSRLASQFRAGDHQKNAAKAIQLLSTYDASRTLIEAGLYVSGSNIEIDEALERRAPLQSFLQQAVGERSTFSTTCEQLDRTVKGSA